MEFNLTDEQIYFLMDAATWISDFFKIIFMCFAFISGYVICYLKNKKSEVDK